MPLGKRSALSRLHSWHARRVAGTLSVPSLLGYVESLGGDKHVYGLLGTPRSGDPETHSRMAIALKAGPIQSEPLQRLCAGCFSMARLLCMGFYGFWVDRRPYKEVFAVSLGSQPELLLRAAVGYAPSPAFASS